jgi:hypothetical protein
MTGQLLQLVGRAEGAATGQDGDALPGVEQVRGALQALLGREGQSPALGDGVGVALQVPLAAAVVSQALEVHREVDVGDPAAGQGGPAGVVGDVLDVGDAHHAGVVDRHVGEHAVEVHVLLGARVDQVVKVVAGDSQDRLAVELGVVEAVQRGAARRARWSPGRRRASR